VGGEPLRRRVWGQRPGQPGGSPPIPPERRLAVELVLQARGLRITDEIREAALEKIGKLEKLHPSILRVEVEIIAERNPRLTGTKRVEALLHAPRKRFRAHAEEREVKRALDRVADRLGRQLREHRNKGRRRAVRGSNRLRSAGTRGAISS